ncbi:MAG: hypothetical protein M3320_03495 [Actinomycetota bacterium]|nr:hypothetical protein [Actinomycetota bacterium]
MQRTAPLLSVLVVLVLLALAAPASAAQACATGSKAQAAQALYGSGTEVVGTERVAGLRTALVLEPLIAPGTRHRMIATGGGWCDATTGFNAATSLTGADAATTYARLAAAPYFDGVTVRDVRSAGDVHTVTTHARTNGVVATWVVVTDAQGVKTARWTATAFAQKPFVAQVEGLTALPDATDAYERVAGGTLRGRNDILAMARAAEDEPGIGVGFTGGDGFRVDVSYSEARTAPQVGQETGVFDVDFIRMTKRAVERNYADFIQWGLTGDAWEGSDGQGYVYINDALSTYCLACVLISDMFNIHVNSHAHEALGALGYQYPGVSVEDVWTDILGHELFHNFQNRYNDPGLVASLGNRLAGFYYLEGTARLQEAFHDYSHISHQPESLIYANDANGCNGFDGGGAIHVPPLTVSPDMDREMVKGPFNTSRTYAACYFWMPWYTRHGWDGLKKLVTEAMPAAIEISDQNEEGLTASTAASGETMLEQQRMFAVHALTGGRGMNTFGPILGGEERDWSVHLESWQPKPLEPGTPHTRRLQTGGLMASEITERMRVTLDGPKDEIRMFVVRDDGATVSTKSFKGGRLGPPSEGEKLFVVAVRPVVGDPVDVTLTGE